MERLSVYSKQKQKVKTKIFCNVLYLTVSVLNKNKWNDFA